MDIVCKGCSVRLRIPDTHIVGNRLKVRCKNCGSPIILLGEGDNIQALGATIPPQTQQHQLQHASTPIQRSAPGHVSPAASISLRSKVRESAPSDEPETKQLPTFEGARNENSVLFTLSNLKDIAKKRQAAATEKAAARDGYASGDGSGYIDIRALVQLSRQNAPTVVEDETNATEMSTTERSEPTVPVRTDLPSLTFQSTESLAPVTLASESSNRALPIAIVAGGAMLAAGVVISLNIINQDNPNRLSAAGRSIARFVNTNLFETGIDTDSIEPSAPVDSVQENRVVEPVVQTTPVIEPSIAKPEVEQPVVTPSRKDHQNEELMAPVRLPIKKSKVRGETVAKRSVGKSKSISAALAKPGPVIAKARVETERKAKGYSIDDILAGDTKGKNPASETKPSKPRESEPSQTDPLLDPIPTKKPSQEDRSVDDLLDQAIEKGDKPKAEPAAPGPDATPETPSRQQVMTTLRKITPAAKACAASLNESSVAKLTIVVKGSSGQVSGVQAEGIAEPIRSCVVREVMKAHFPAFAKPELSINYPLKLK